MSAVGDTSSNATLSNFLQSFASNMQNVSPLGNVVSTQS
jgi:hypothetical protein